jgi:Dna[CI] antecedent, DciA
MTDDKPRMILFERGSMSIPNRRGPRPLSEILGELFTLRGYGRLQARQELEDAWNAAVGEPSCRQTRLGEVRRGVLNVTVAHSTLLEELMAFRKPALLAALRSGAPATTIHDIRFRVGEIRAETKPTTGPSVHPVSSSNVKPNHKPQIPHRTRVEDRPRPEHGSGQAPEQP